MPKKTKTLSLEDKVGLCAAILRNDHDLTVNVVTADAITDDDEVTTDKGSEEITANKPDGKRDPNPNKGKGSEAGSILLKVIGDDDSTRTFDEDFFSEYDTPSEMAAAVVEALDGDLDDDLGDLADDLDDTDEED